jgi:hypothetical protein
MRVDRLGANLAALTVFLFSSLRFRGKPSEQSVPAVCPVLSGIGAILPSE